MTGFFKLQRGITGHPLFKGRPQWFLGSVWLIENAAWKATPFDVQGGIVTLERGQICVSEEQLSAATGVTRKQVRTFPERLKSEGMIVAEPGQKWAKSRANLTLCNFETFQEEAS